MCAASRIPTLPSGWQSASADERLKLLAGAFERAWREGSHPSVTEFIEAASDVDEEALRCRLTDLEQRLRGESPPSESHGGLPEGSAAPGEPLESRDSDDLSLSSTVALPPGAGPDLPGERAPPATLGRYRLVALLGRGGFGEVWRGHDPLLNRSVAVKRARPDARRRPADEFLAEGRKLAQLGHPGIVRVHDVGFEDGTCFIVSELVEGETLAARAHRRALPWEEAARLVAEVAEAAHAAHLRGIVHRDIKPSNILIDADGRARLADFGLAITEEEQLDERAATLGTYAYMSPEQLAGRSNQVDARADVYSLGVVLYQLLTGRLPFVGKTPTQYRELVLSREPRPPRTIVESIPPVLEEVCLRCLARDIASRPTTAHDLAAALRSVPSPSVAAHPRRRRALAALAVAGTLAVLGIAGWSRLRPARDVPLDDRQAHPGVDLPSVDGHAGPTSLVGDSSEVRVEPLVWRASDASGGWQATNGGSTLRAESKDCGLLKTMDLAGENPTIDLDLHQVRWTGGIGVFFGHRREWVDGAQRGSFEGLAIEAHPDGGWQVVRVLNEYQVDSPSAWNGWNTASTRISDPGPAPLALRLRFAGGRLDSVTLAGSDLAELTTLAADSPASGRSCEGSLGLMLTQSGGSLSNLRVDGRARRFATLQAERPTPEIADELETP
jgi:hypothetical protein